MLNLTHARQGPSRYLTTGSRETLYLRVPAELKEKVETASALEGMSLNEWIIRLLEKTVR